MAVSQGNVGRDQESRVFGQDAKPLPAASGIQRWFICSWKMAGNALCMRTGEEIINLFGKMQMLSASDLIVWIQGGQVARTAKRGEVKIKVGSVDGKTLA